MHKFSAMVRDGGDIEREIIHMAYWRAMKLLRFFRIRKSSKVFM